MSMAKGNVALPPWWTLATIVFGVLFGVWLLFSALTSSEGSVSADAAAIPSYALAGGASGPTTTVLTPAVKPSAKPANKPSVKPSAAPATAPVISNDEPLPTPREVSRANSVFNVALFDDGNVVDVATPDSSVPVPYNMFATAMAAFYAELDPDVAMSLPTLGSRPAPVKNFRNGSISSVTLVKNTDTTFTFSALVDYDGAGPRDAREVKRTIKDTDAGYFVVTS